MASAGITIWMAGPAGVQLAFGVFIRGSERCRWTGLTGLGTVSMTLAGEATASCGRTGICLTGTRKNTRDSTAAAATPDRTGTQCRSLEGVFCPTAASQ